MKPLRGRVIVDLISCSHTRDSGLVIINRTDVSDSGKVVAVGAESMDAKYRPIKVPCKCGDTVWFKKYKPMFHQYDQSGMRKGLVTIWFHDLCLVKSKPWRWCK